MIQLCSFAKTIENLPIWQFESLLSKYYCEKEAKQLVFTYYSFTFASNNQNRKIL